MSLISFDDDDAGYEDEGYEDEEGWLGCPEWLDQVPQILDEHYETEYDNQDSTD